jgi:hypothetical protein
MQLLSCSIKPPRIQLTGLTILLAVMIRGTCCYAEQNPKACSNDHPIRGRASCCDEFWGTSAVPRCFGRVEVGADIRSECVLALLTLRLSGRQTLSTIRARAATVTRKRKKEINYPVLEAPRLLANSRFFGSTCITEKVTTIFHGC